LHASWGWDVVVHALPCVLVPEAAHLAAGHLLRSHSLLLVLPLFEHELLLGVEAGTRSTRCAPRGLAAVLAAAALHAALLLETVTATAALHAAHLLHLLHHLRIHALHAALRHHLLHHLRIHALHALILIHGHLLLHHSEVLLHTLPVRRHHRRRHIRRILLITAHLILLAAVETLVKIVLTATTPELATSTPPTTVLLPHIATRLRALDFNRLIADRQRPLQRPINRRLTIERDKAKPTRTTGLLIHHQRRIQHIAEIPEEIRKVVLTRILTDAADEDLRRALLLVSRNRSLRIDLFGFEISTFLLASLPRHLKSYKFPV
jgi:hypothetical protein